MTITELLAAHRTLDVAHLAHSVAMCKCGTLFENRPAHRAHVAEVLEQHMQEREARAWDKAAECAPEYLPPNPYRKESSDGRE